MDNPLTRSVPKEMPLKNAPLIKVIAQIRFPLIASIEKIDFIAAFQESVRDNYPILRPEKAISIVFGPAGSSGNASQTVWRFSSQEHGWTISLSQDFIAIETSLYSSRSDFLKKWNRILEAATEHLKIRQYERFGMRYIDRIENDAMGKIKKFLRQELNPLDSFKDDQINHSFSEALFNIDDAKLLARWGKLAANTTFDPAAIKPCNNDSWVLDLDAFSHKSQMENIDLVKIQKQSEYFAERIYSFFRWAVTDDFIKYYGGKI